MIRSLYQMTRLRKSYVKTLSYHQEVILKKLTLICCAIWNSNQRRPKKMNSQMMMAMVPQPSKRWLRSSISQSFPGLQTSGSRWHQVPKNTPTALLFASKKVLNAFRTSRDGASTKTWSHMLKPWKSGTISLVMYGKPSMMNTLTHLHGSLRTSCTPIRKRSSRALLMEHLTRLNASLLVSSHYLRSTGETSKLIWPFLFMKDSETQSNAFQTPSNCSTSTILSSIPIFPQWLRLDYFKSTARVADLLSCQHPRTSLQRLKTWFPKSFVREPMTLRNGWRKLFRTYQSQWPMLKSSLNRMASSTSLMRTSRTSVTEWTSSTKSTTLCRSSHWRLRKKTVTTSLRVLLRSVNFHRLWQMLRARSKLTLKHSRELWMNWSHNWIHLSPSFMKRLLTPCSFLEKLTCLRYWRS